MLCSGISPGALSGHFVLVLRGTCDFSVKVTNAQNSGALGVILIDNGTGLSPWSVGTSALIPAFLVSQTNGANLKTYIDANSGASVTMNPNPFQSSASTQYVDDKCFPTFANPATGALIPESVACFASLGPIFGTGGVEVKPDAAAAATDFLLAAQNYDPEGELFNANQYGVADGTSFSTPMFSRIRCAGAPGQPRLYPLTGEVGTGQHRHCIGPDQRRWFGARLSGGRWSGDCCRRRMRSLPTCNSFRRRPAALRNIRLLRHSKRRFAKSAPDRDGLQ